MLPVTWQQGWGLNDKPLFNLLRLFIMQVKIMRNIVSWSIILNYCEYFAYHFNELLFHNVVPNHLVIFGKWQISITEISKWTVGDGRQKKINLISMKNTLFQRVTVCICLVFLTLSTPFLLQQLHHNSFL